jgi:hypothetical protein
MLPAAMPDRFDGPSAWVGEDLAQTPDLWLHHLTDAEIAELEEAARAYLATGRDIGEIDAGSFALPRLAPKLADLRQTLLKGIGFRVLRGLPVGRLSLETAAAIFCGIGAHLGRAVSERRRPHPRPCARSGRGCQRSQHPHLPDRGAADLSHRQRRRRGSFVPARGDGRRRQPACQCRDDLQPNARRAPDLLALCSIRSRRTGGARCRRA